MTFIPGPQPPVNPPYTYVVAVTGTSILACPEQSWRPLRFHQLQAAAPDLISSIEHHHYLGLYCGKPCHAVYIPPAQTPAAETQGYVWVGLRSQLGQIEDDLFRLAGRALQIANWYNYHRFCGCCGAPTRLDAVDRAKVCDTCDARYYPRLSPCVIGLIERDDHCLLAHNLGFSTGKYSAIAGFIEPGETAEQALAREIKEEVGLQVTNMRYFASQPWPFPGQLMLGFHADYASGEIEVDQVEIGDAQWFHANKLPLTPSAGTISGQLIKDFVQRTSKA